MGGILSEKGALGVASLGGHFLGGEIALVQLRLCPKPSPKGRSGHLCITCRPRPTCELRHCGHLLPHAVLRDGRLGHASCVLSHARFLAAGTTSGAIVLMRINAPLGHSAAEAVDAALGANRSGKDTVAVLGDSKSGKAALGVLGHPTAGSHWGSKGRSACLLGSAEGSDCLSSSY